jgi:peptidoglycan/xylan/chitin deacetylase (PgdA/CDA1 family)
MNINNPPQWLRFFYRSFHWNINTGKKELFLTFDDGPTVDVTLWVLDQLDKYKAKATFFCIGRNVDKYPDIYKEIIERGHSVGNHTYSHLKGWIVKNKEYINDIELASLHINSNMFRAPYGKIRTSQIRLLKKKGYRLFMWDVLSEDYNNNITNEQCVQNVMSNVSDGSIIVFHDSVKARKNLYYTLPIVLETLVDQGYVFSKIK